MRLSRVLGALLLVALLSLIAGCAGVRYRARATVTCTRYTTVENFGDEEIAAEQIDGLLGEVAELLHVTLHPRMPKVRIMVVSPARIAAIYQGLITAVPHGADAEALYLPAARLIMIPNYNRRLLGHELAHYVTDHYLKSTPRGDWERIAFRVENALPSAARTAKGTVQGWE